MSAADCAVPSKQGLTPSISDYTMPRDLAREWLGCSSPELDTLVQRSRLNASRGLVGPLELVNGGTHFTLRSVFDCRRIRAALAR